MIFRQLSIAAKRLHSVERNLKQSLGSEQFGFGHIGIGWFATRQFVSGIIDQQPGCREFGFVVSHTVFEHLIGRELLAKCVTFAQILLGVI